MKTAIFATILLVLLFGCISTETTHQQFADGSAMITIKNDVSILSSSAYAETYSSLFEESCDYYDSSVSCEEEDGVITVSKRISKEEAFYKFEVKDDLITRQYRLTVDELPDFSSSYDAEGLMDSYSYDYGSPYADDSYSSYLSDTYKISDSKSKAIGNTIEQMGMEYTYTVEMPGTIISAEGGEIEDNKAVFDVAERMQEREPIVVISEEYNFLMILIIAVIAIIGIAGVAFVLSRRGDGQ